MNRKARRDFVLLALPGVALTIGLIVLLGWSDTYDAAAAPPTFSNYVVCLASDPAIEPIVSEVASVAPTPAVAAPDTVPDVQDGLARPALLPLEYRVTIVDEHGHPVPNARVRLVERPDFRINVATNDDDILGRLSERELGADDDGELGFLGRKGSAYEVYIEAAGYAPKRYRLIDPGRRIVRLFRPAAVAGRVFDDRGSPLSGIEVELWSDDQASERVLTDFDGYYDFPSVSPDTATLEVRSPFYQRQIKHLEIASDERYENADFYLQPGGVLNVRVYDVRRESVPNATVRLIELNSGLECGRRAADADGMASFACVRDARDYLIVADAPEVGTARKSFKVPAGSDVTGPQAVIDQEIELLRTWTMSGYVTFLGEPVADARVVLESESVGLLTASRHATAVYTDMSGRFVASGLLGGLSYSVLVYHHGFAMTIVSGIDERQAEVEPVSVALRGSGTLEGYALDENNQPIANAFVVITIEGPFPGVVGTEVTVRTDDQGRYYIANLPIGPVHIEVHDFKKGQISVPTTVDVREHAEDKKNLRHR